jgi:hypothetical protein
MRTMRKRATARTWTWTRVPPPFVDLISDDEEDEYD